MFRSTMRFLCIVVDCYHAFDIFLQLYLSVAQLKVVLEVSESKNEVSDPKLMSLNLKMTSRTQN